MPLTGEAKREYQRQWVAKRREDYFADKNCEECGSTERLELDHKDPKQKVTHRIWSWSRERREAELKKCQILCEGCHKEKTSLYNQEKFSYDESGFCRRGHPLALVGMYIHSAGGKNCRYCQHITCQIRRGGRVKSLEVFIEGWQGRKGVL